MDAEWNISRINRELESFRGCTADSSLLASRLCCSLRDNLMRLGFPRRENFHLLMYVLYCRKRCPGCCTASDFSRTGGRILKLKKFLLKTKAYMVLGRGPLQVWWAFSWRLNRMFWAWCQMSRFNRLCRVWSTLSSIFEKIW